jgi:hypothetical protein
MQHFVPTLTNWHHSDAPEVLRGQPGCVSAKSGPVSDKMAHAASQQIACCKTAANTMPFTSFKEIYILGVTRSGKTFRPSDWAERLAGVMSQYPNKKAVLSNGFFALLTAHPLQTADR